MSKARVWTEGWQPGYTDEIMEWVDGGRVFRLVGWGATTFTEPFMELQVAPYYGEEE